MTIIKSNGADSNLVIMQYLKTVYSSKERYYHDINHINYMRSKLMEYVSSEMSVDDFPIFRDILTAIWFHDIEYNIWNPPGFNESQSVDQYMSIYGLTELDSVGRAIVATASHLEDQIIPDTDEGTIIKVLLDIDLVSFSEAFDIVLYNSENVLREYEPMQLERDILLQNRNNFLRKLLKRQRLFYTDYFYNLYEDQARSNIDRLIEHTNHELLNGTISHD